jgi:hypothetical protein
MFADEQVALNISNLAPPFTQFLLPIALLPLAVFVALVQTLVFTLLSMIYLGEVSHAPHDKHEHGTTVEHSDKTGEGLTTAHV